MVIAAANDPPGLLPGSIHRTIKFGSDNLTGSHGIVTGSNDSANIINSINICIADTVLNGTLHTPRYGPDLALFPVIANDYSLFNGTVGNGCYKRCRTSGVKAHSLICANKARL